LADQGCNGRPKRGTLPFLVFQAQARVIYFRHVKTNLHPLNSGGSLLAPYGRQSSKPGVIVTIDLRNN
jgi:hypothetical protein